MSALTIGELYVAVRPDPEAPVGSAEASGLVLQPGEEGFLLAIEALDERKPFKIVSMACNQHPNTVYTYVFDSKQRKLLVPLGTLINPMYTCKDLGAYIEAQVFAIYVRNDDTKAHTYVGQVIYKETR